LTSALSGCPPSLEKKPLPVINRMIKKKFYNGNPYKALAKKIL